MKVIGTGLTGLVGSRIIELNPDIEFINISLETGISILDPQQLETVFAAHPDADAVLHLAAFTDTNAAWDQKGDQSGLCYQLNVVGTQNIVNLCQKYGKYLIHISTDYVFDGQKPTPYLEDDPTSAIEWYGETKAMAEKVVLNSGISASIARLAFPYRAKYDLKVDIVRKIKQKIENGDTLNLFDDQITTPTYIDDIAAGLKIFFEQKPVGIYHLVGSSSQSPFEMAQMIAQVFGLDNSKIMPSKLADYLKTENARPFAKNAALNNDKIKTLGITTKTLQEGLEDMKRCI
ncbi:NAD(P)-dependent oxidoreductase [Patescibacteria group bacterium]|nr:NAD(P)-dependent oxidoreductase [Patescibacteria group bacterium]